MTSAAPTAPPETPPGVDLERLLPFFAEHVEGAALDRPLRATMLTGGSSNLTYVVSDGVSEWVLRRQPLGHVLPTAHDMIREHRIQAALATTDVPVARMFAVCDDPAINGGPFYVMERMYGVVLSSVDVCPHYTDADARSAAGALIDALARLHVVDPAAVGLADFGRPDGYVERQVRRWSQQWERSKQRELPQIDELIRRLHGAIPQSGPPAIVHGDYNFRNVMLAADDPGALLAVFDWEMATLGDPLADLGLLLCYWGRGEGLPPFSSRGEIGASLGPQDWPSNSEMAAMYERASGRAVDQIDFYVVLALYKLAVIMEGIYSRYRQGLTVEGVGGDHIEQLVTDLVEAGLSIAGASGLPGLRG
jgi:aminoglycoside phosphotransferase (APT) family kinase protein